MTISLNAVMDCTHKDHAAGSCLQELRVRGSYLHHKEIKAAQGVKIAAQNLESAVAGTQMLVAQPNDDIEVLKAEVMEDMKDIFGSVDRSGQPFLPGFTSLHSRT